MAPVSYLSSSCIFSFWVSLTLLSHSPDMLHGSLNAVEFTSSSTVFTADFRFLPAFYTHFSVVTITTTTLSVPFAPSWSFLLYKQVFFTTESTLSTLWQIFLPVLLVLTLFTFSRSAKMQCILLWYLKYQAFLAVCGTGVNKFSPTVCSEQSGLLQRSTCQSAQIHHCNMHKMQQ